ncbi:hypothetical protein HDV01_007483 [Terramyces sp. JEL0728]|nr:hypothetical protein HDV01_007483 [Terramyces sp. JEL0728]
MKVEKATRQEIEEVGLPWMNRHLDECNVMASIFFNKHLVDWFLVTKDNTVQGVAMHDTSRKSLLLPSIDPEAIPLLAALITDINSLNGVKSSAMAFAEAYSKLHDLKFSIHQELLIYVLDKQDFNCRMFDGRVPTEFTDDIVDQTVTLRNEFDNELQLLIKSPQHTRDPVRRLMEAKEFFAWVDTVDGKEKVVSIAGYRKNETGNMYRVGFVFTLKELRSRGYASSIVSFTTKKCFADGCNQVLLFADAANPVSNSVYQKLGFKERKEAVNIEFQGVQ